MNPQEPANFELPDFGEPQKPTPACGMPFEAVVRETGLFVEYYLEHYDSPEARFASKNPEPFVL